MTWVMVAAWVGIAALAIWAGDVVVVGWIGVAKRVTANPATRVRRGNGNRMLSE